MNEYTINIPLNEYERLKRRELEADDQYVRMIVELASYMSEHGIHRDFKLEHDFAQKRVSLRDLLRSKYWAIYRGLDYAVENN